jgi:hypothetical protein
MAAKKIGHIKTYSASLGTGYVELDSSGESLRFDAHAIIPGTELPRSGDEVFVRTTSRGKVRMLEPIKVETDASPLPELQGSAATVNLDGHTPARFNASSFVRTAERLDFTDGV